VSSTFASGSTSLSLGGTYYAASIGSTSLTGYTKDVVAINLGNPTSNNLPAFLALGVGDHSTLYAYDLLQLSTTPLSTVADGVFELHALYGVDTNSDGKVDNWEKPANSSTYSLSALMAGTTASATLLSNIKAIRVGLIMRTSLTEKDQVAPASLTLFSDLGSTLQYTRTLSSTERKYRYRTFETTIPLRNNLLVE
jgi:type IV pilus assembly protein PilW